MANKNVQLKNASGDLLYPKTLGSQVLNNSGNALGTVEAGAQVNVLEKITVNGTELTISNKTAAITIASSAEYTIKKLTSSDTSLGYDSQYAGQYILTKDNVKVGDVINLAKDMVLDTVELKTCSTADSPVVGYVVGDKYIEFTFQNKASSKLYLKVSELADVYTAGNGLTLTNGAFAVNTTDTNIADTTPTASSAKFVQSGGVYTALLGKQDTLSGSNKLSTDYISGLANVATTGAYSDLTGTPVLATVATSGAYSDLTGTPTIPDITWVEIV